MARTTKGDVRDKIGREAVGVPLIPLGADRAASMSLRDYFAGQALTGYGWQVCDGDDDDAIADRDIAVEAYKLADAMLAARKAGR